MLSRMVRALVPQVYVAAQSSSDRSVLTRRHAPVPLISSVTGEVRPDMRHASAIAWPGRALDGWLKLKRERADDSDAMRLTDRACW